MKQSGILLVILLVVGCAPVRTLEELEDAAVRTGDWSLVEEREALLARRDSRRPMQCDGRLVSYCEKSVGVYRCNCVAKNLVFTSIAR